MNCDLNDNGRLLTKMPDRTPISGTFELTVRCNLHCKMCLFRHDDSENEKIIQNELSASQWIDMAKQAAEAGTMNLLLTGGEPFLRKDFCEIYKGIYKQGFIITLYTNATLVTDKIMDTLKKYPPHKIGITIYGASPETYQKVCGNGNAFERMVEGVHRLQELPSVLEFRTTIIKDNFPDMDKITELVHKEFQKDAMVTCSTTVTKAVRGACANVEACRLDPETEHRMHLNRKLELIHDFIGESFDINNIRVEDQEITLVDNRRAPLLGCPAGRSSYTITWDGQLIACQMLGFFHTDAKNLGLKTAWEMLPNKIVLPPPSKKCQECDVAEYCESCYATRYAETGSLDGCSEHLYQNASMLKKITNEFRRKEK